MRDALRTCLQIAGGLTEATRRRAVGAARELLDQTGVDVEAVRRKVGESIPPEVQALADELVAAGRANRDLLVGLIREEVDKTKDRVGRVADEVTKVGVILEALERRVRNLEGGAEEPAAAPAAAKAPPRERVRVDADEADRGGAAGEGKRVVPVTTVGPRTGATAGGEAKPEKGAVAKRTTTRRAAAPETPGGLAPAARAAAKRAGTAEGEGGAAAKKAAPVKKAPAKKTPAVKKTAAAKKTAAKKTQAGGPAESAQEQKARAEKAAAAGQPAPPAVQPPAPERKAPAKKAAEPPAAKKAAAQKPTAQKSTAQKSTAKKTAAKKTTVKKTTPEKTTAQKAAAKKTPAKKTAPSPEQGPAAQASANGGRTGSADE